MVNTLTIIESARRLFVSAVLAAMLVWGATAAAQQSGMPQSTPTPQQPQSATQAQEKDACRADG